MRVIIVSLLPLYTSVRTLAFFFFFSHCIDIESISKATQHNGVL